MKTFHIGLAFPSPIAKIYSKRRHDLLVKPLKTTCKNFKTVGHAKWPWLIDHSEGFIQKPKTFFTESFRLFLICMIFYLQLFANWNIQHSHIKSQQIKFKLGTLFGLKRKSFCISHLLFYFKWLSIVIFHSELKLIVTVNRFSGGAMH